MPNDNAKTSEPVKFPREEILGHSSAAVVEREEEQQRLVETQHTVVNFGKDQQQKQSYLSARGATLLSPEYKEVTKGRGCYLSCHISVCVLVGVLIVLLSGYTVYSELRYRTLETRLETIEYYHQLRAQELSESSPHYSQHHGEQDSDGDNDFTGAGARPRSARHLSDTQPSSVLDAKVAKPVKQLSTTSSKKMAKLSSGKKPGQGVTPANQQLTTTVAPQPVPESPYLLHVTPVKNTNPSSEKSRDYVWEPSPWSTRELAETFVREKGGSVFIQQAGIYLIYSHSVVFVGEASSVSKFELKRAADQGQGKGHGHEEVIAQCIQSQKMNGTERAHNTCSLVTVAYLQPGDKLRFGDAHCMSSENYPCRHALSEKYSFYWGLIKLR